VQAREAGADYRTRSRNSELVRFLLVLVRRGCAAAFAEEQAERPGRPQFGRRCSHRAGRNDSNASGRPSGDMIAFDVRG